MSDISARLGNAGRETRQHLQQRLMGFVDRSMSRMEEATDGIVFSTQDPTVRSAAHETKYYTLLAMVSLAADIRPEVSLVDLMVMTRLERSKWGEAWCNEFMGAECAAALRRAQSDIERDIWSIGAEYLDAAEIERLKALVDDWRAAHPDRKYLTRVRLDSIAQMRGGETFTQRVSGGLFAPVSEATRAAEELKLLGERALYLAERTPLLLAWQAEVLTYDLARTPEALRLLANADALTKAVQEGSKALARLDSEQGGYERALKDLTEVLEKADQTSAHVQQTVLAASRLAERLEALLREVDRTLATLTATADRVMPLVGGAAGGEGATGGASSGAVPQTSALDNLVNALGELSELIRQTDAMMKSAAWDQRLNDVNEAARARVEHAETAGTALINLAFQRGLVLLGAAGATVIGVTLILRLIPPRRAAAAPVG